MTKPIRLSHTAVALVDDADYERLIPYQWFLSGTGYAVGFVPINGKFQLIYMHRLILNAKPDEMVDHVCGTNKLDNRRSNLRLVTPQQNGQHKRLSAHSATGFKGVGWHQRRRRYHARIQLQGIRYHLGFFDTPEEAALAYDAAARRLFGEYAQCNYPEKRTPPEIGLLVAHRLKQRGVKVDC